MRIENMEFDPRTLEIDSPKAKKEYLFRPGGLMRCCEASLSKYMEKATKEPKEGDQHHCQYCKNPIVFHNGAWQWDKDAPKVIIA